MPAQGITETIKSISANSMSSGVVSVPTVSTETTISAIIRNPLVIIAILAIIVGLVVVISKIINKNK